MVTWQDAICQRTTFWEETFAYLIAATVTSYYREAVTAQSPGFASTLGSKRALNSTRNGLRLNRLVALDYLRTRLNNFGGAKPIRSGDPSGPTRYLTPTNRAFDGNQA